MLLVLVGLTSLPRLKIHGKDVVRFKHPLPRRGKLGGLAGRELGFHRPDKISKRMYPAKSRLGGAPAASWGVWGRETFGGEDFLAGRSLFRHPCFFLLELHQLRFNYLLFYCVWLGVLSVYKRMTD